MSVLVHARDRRAIRRAVQVDCQIIRESDFKLVGERTIDLSPDGMLVRTDVDVKPGEDLIVSFRATPYDIYFDTEAVVARVEQGRRAKDRGRCIGIQFCSLDPIARHILRGNLRRIPPPLPRRRQRVDYALTVKWIARQPAFSRLVAG